VGCSIERVAVWASLIFSLVSRSEDMPHHWKEAARACYTSHIQQDYLYEQSQSTEPMLEP
jgi:hypothetical protein